MRACFSYASCSRQALTTGSSWNRCPTEVPEIGCDNNPDITDFLGYGEVHYSLALDDREKPALLNVMVGGNLAEGNERLKASFAYPARSKNVYWFAWAHHGYGESLLDYNRSITRIGVGFAFYPQGTDGAPGF